MRAFIPANFDFDTIFPGEQKYKDKYYYIIHKIIQDRVYNKYREYDSFIPLNTKILRYVIGGYHLIRIIRNLIDAKIIERDGQYIPGHKSIGYRLSRDYRGTGIKELEIVNKRINTRVNLFKNEQYSEIPDFPEYAVLKKWLEKIEIDYENAMQSIKMSFSIQREKLRKRLKNLKMKYSKIPFLRHYYIIEFIILYNELIEESYSIQDKFDCELISINNLQYKEHFMVIDNTSGRVHTNITNLKSELRHFLRYDGKLLFNIDIRNSQPFLFNILIKYFFSKNSLEFHILTHDFFYLTSSNIIYNCNHNYTYSNFLPYEAGFEDLILYEKLTSSGKFYEFLMEKSGIDSNERKKFKKDFFGKVFFSRNNDNYEFKEKKIFKKHFPNVYDAIYYFKKKAHRDLPIALQKAEVNIIINTIVRRIATYNPEIFITTIHDSIMTTEDNIEYVKKVILEEFENKFNLKPTLKVE